MATSDEILAALADYQTQCNQNERLRRMQKDWTRRLHFHAQETDDWFTMVVVAGYISLFAAGQAGRPDIVVQASSEDLCDMFWGDLNPSQKYLRGEILVKAAPEDVMRLDAITLIIWPD
jgi:putative sterol carrier protein